MTGQPSNCEQFDRWLLDIAEKAATSKETARINELLTSDAELRAYAARRLIDESLLYEELQIAEAESLFAGQSILPSVLPGVKTSDGEQSVESVPRAWRRFDVRTALFVLAACLVVALSINAFVIWRDGHAPNAVAPIVERASDSDDATAFATLESEGVALLRRAVNVQWETGEPPARVDETIGPRRIKIASGLLQLDFFSGATVVLEGPADLQIESAMRCECRYGKLRAEVPPQAIGFTIGGGAVDVVDLGTEFAMRIDQNGQGELHILDGEVVTVRHGRDGERRTLRDGQAVRIERQGSLVDLAVDREKFVDAAQLKQLDDTDRADRYQKWLAHSRRWANDPAAVLYFNFERPDSSDRRLQSALAKSSPSQDGAIVGCRWTEGRFVGKGALEFKRTSDRVRVHLPGEFQSLSFVAWLRVEGFDQWYNSLLLSDGYGPGQVHWQLTQEGLLKLSVGNDRSYPTPQILKPSDLGRWVHLAAVYDHERRIVRQYLDGEIVAETEIGTPLPLTLGSAEIGNWNSLKHGRNSVRSLNGLLDEFAVFSRALSVQEIRDAYVAGNPHR